MTIDRPSVAAAVRALDLDALADRRWYASKGERPSSARLAHAFALAPDAVLALVDLRAGERGEGTERYAVPFILRDGAVLEAAEGHGAWRALAAAIAEGRTIPARRGQSAPARRSATRGRFPKRRSWPSTDRRSC